MQPDFHHKPRLRTRVPRTGKGYEVKEEGDQSWAVSYADLLMVLLSFFILFFSVDDKQKESLIQTLAVTINSKSGQGSAVSANDKTAENTTGNTANIERQPQFVDPQVLEDLSRELNIKTTALADQLIIDLPNDIFKMGATFPKNDSLPIIETLFKKLLPFSQKISFTIVGHTDQSAVLYSKKPWLQDNIDLSARRATAAYKIAKAIGFSEQQMDIKAAGPYVRNTRSLSIIINEKVGAL